MQQHVTSFLSAVQQSNNSTQPVVIQDTNVAVDDASEVLDTHSLETRGHPSLPGSHAAQAIHRPSLQTRGDFTRDIAQGNMWSTARRHIIRTQTDMTKRITLLCIHARCNYYHAAMLNIITLICL